MFVINDFNYITITHCRISYEELTVEVNERPNATCNRSETGEDFSSPSGFMVITGVPDIFK